MIQVKCPRHGFADTDRIGSPLLSIREERTMKTVSTCLGLALLLMAGVAQASNCTIKLDSNDRMQFDQKSVTVSAACTEIAIELTHSGSLPAAAMGHNVVVVATADTNAVAQAGLQAGAANQYLPADDTRVIAATEMIGGGENTRTAFPGSLLEAGGDYTFFCSFPGHAALMRGTIVVTP